MKNSRVWIVVVALAFLCCCCLPALLFGGLMMFSSQPTTYEGESVEEPNVEITAAATMEAFIAPPPPELPQHILGRIGEVETQVSTLRLLEVLDETQYVLVTPQQLQQRMIEQLDVAHPPQVLAFEQHSLALFGLLSPHANLRTLYLQAYQRPTFAYYDINTGEMLLFQEGRFNGPQRLDYAREFVHALQDQHYDLADLGLGDEDCYQKSDSCAALYALVHGDASLVEQLWYFTYATPQDQRQLREEGNEILDMEDIPPFLAEEMVFPYREGLNFVQTFYDQDGWTALERLYRTPPASTEQILHPERYPADQPLPVSLPEGLDEVLGQGWQEEGRNTLGEWYIYLMLAFANDPAQRLGQLTAQQAADGWGGDQYVLLTQPETQQRALVWVTRWDSETEAYDFWTAFKEYGLKRWKMPLYQSEHEFWWADTPDGSIRMRLDGDRVGLVIVPGETAAADVINFLESEMIP